MFHVLSLKALVPITINLLPRGEICSLQKLHVSLSLKVTPQNQLFVLVSAVQLLACEESINDHLRHLRLKKEKQC